jgi:holo-[acyl-carrier protein] synthase
MINIGIDIVSINRIEKMINRFGDKGLKKFLSPKEIKISKNKVSSIAGFWATKEAFSKALGTGIGKQLSFHHININKLPSGKPYIELTPYLKENFKIKNSDISITHDGGFAISAVIVERD